MHNACRCPQCYGLREHMLDATGKDYGLPRAPGCARARGLTLANQEHCQQTLTCTCTDCRLDRTRLIEEAPQRRARIRQPWEPKRAA